MLNFCAYGAKAYVWDIGSSVTGKKKKNGKWKFPFISHVYISLVLWLLFFGKYREIMCGFSLPFPFSIIIGIMQFVTENWFAKKYMKMRNLLCLSVLL